VLNDQLTDYGVDVRYVQAHIDGLSSRLVLDLDDSLTVLREEAGVSWTDSNDDSNPAGTSGTAWIISRSLTLGHDEAGCPRTICPDLWI
jgi:hypothetical protein